MFTVLEVFRRQAWRDRGTMARRKIPGFENRQYMPEPIITPTGVDRLLVTPSGVVHDIQVKIEYHHPDGTHERFFAWSAPLSTYQR